MYSLAVDGPIRRDASQEGFIAGSKALDALDRFITSTESFFHPSNAGPWSLMLTNLVQRITSEFNKRWYEEKEKSCKTPVVINLIIVMQDHTTYTYS